MSIPPTTGPATTVGTPVRTSGKPVLSEEEQRQKSVDDLPGQSLIIGGIMGVTGLALGKVKGGSWMRAAATGAIAGGIIGATLATTGAIRYLNSGPESKPGYVGPIATGAQIAIGGVGALAAMSVIYGHSLIPFAGIVGKGGRAAATASATGGGMLAKYSTDLTEAAKNGEISRAFGVDDKVDELVAVLGATRKNNPLIVGPAGTGKTALVEELAHRIVLGQVPDHLKDVKIVLVDLDAMVAGTVNRGMFEERLSGTLKEIEASNGKIIPFIDEVQKLVHAGAAQDVEGAGQSVKPLLARGKLRLIGATTDAPDEIGAIHADPALTRRFTEISITAPDEHQTLNIVRSAAPRFEHPGMRFTDDALKAVVELTQPIVERNQPDKALTLIDTAASRMNIARDAKPQELKALESSIADVRAELGIVSREASDASKLRTATLTSKLAELEPQAAKIEQGWSAARTARDDLAAARVALANPAEGADVVALTARVTELEAAAKEPAQRYPHLFATEITRADIAATPLPDSAANQAVAGAKNQARAGRQMGFRAV